MGREADIDLAADGPVIDGKPSPYVNVLAQAARAAGNLASRLRLAPVSRATGRDASRSAANGRPPSVVDMIREADNA